MVAGMTFQNINLNKMDIEQIQQEAERRFPIMSNDDFYKLGMDDYNPDEGEVPYYYEQYEEDIKQKQLLFITGATWQAEQQSEGVREQSAECISRKYVALMQGEIFVDSRMLPKGIYESRIPCIFPASKTIDELIEDGRQANVACYECIPKSYFDNLAKCNLVPIYLATHNTKAIAPDGEQPSTPKPEEDGKGDRRKRKKDPYVSFYMDVMDGVKLDVAAKNNGLI